MDEYLSVQFFQFLGIAGFLLFVALQNKLSWSVAHALDLYNREMLTDDINCFLVNLFVPSGWSLQNPWAAAKYMPSKVEIHWKMLDTIEFRQNVLVQSLTFHSKIIWGSVLNIPNSFIPVDMMRFTTYQGSIQVQSREQFFSICTIVLWPENSHTCLIYKSSAPSKSLDCSLGACSALGDFLEHSWRNYCCTRGFAML